MEEGDRAGALVHRLRRGRPARAVLRRPGGLRVHRLDGGRPRRHRLGDRGGAALAHSLLLRRHRSVRRGRPRPRGRGGLGQRRRRPRRPGHRPPAGPRAEARGEHLPGRDRRPGDQLHPDRGGDRRAGHRGPGGPLRSLSPTGRGPGLHPRGPGPRRAHRREGRGDARGPVLGPGPRRRSRDRPAGAGQSGPVRSVRPAR